EVEDEVKGVAECRIGITSATGRVASHHPTTESTDDLGHLESDIPEEPTTTLASGPEQGRGVEDLALVAPPSPPTHEERHHAPPLDGAHLQVALVARNGDLVALRCVGVGLIDTEPAAPISQAKPDLVGQRILAERVDSGPTS